MSKPQSFEKAFGRLEEIARLLEGESLPLDEALKLFEEGMNLVETCNGRLSEAEKTITKLSRKDDDLEEELWDPPQN